MQNHVSEVTASPAPTSELLARALSEARELAQLEVRLAKAELKEELVQIKRAAIAGAIGGAFVILALAALVVATIVALGGTAVTALFVAAALAAVGAASLLVAYGSAPKTLLEHTREHLQDDAARLKEHVL